MSKKEKSKTDQAQATPGKSKSGQIVGLDDLQPKQELRGGRMCRLFGQSPPEGLKKPKNQ